jgi:L-lysine 6-transaminase
MVRCEAYLKVVAGEKLLANASRVGARLLAGLEETALAHPGLVSNVRGRGLMCAFDAPTEEARGVILKKALEERLILLPCGPRSVRLRPPLNLSTAEAGEGVRRLRKALQALAPVQ